jgi:hypothetical protein
MLRFTQIRVFSSHFYFLKSVATAAEAHLIAPSPQPAGLFPPTPEEPKIQKVELNPMIMELFGHHVPVPLATPISPKAKKQLDQEVKKAKQQQSQSAVSLVAPEGKSTRKKSNDVVVSSNNKTKKTAKPTKTSSSSKKQKMTRNKKSAVSKSKKTLKKRK